MDEKVNDVGSVTEHIYSCPIVCLIRSYTTILVWKDSVLSDADAAIAEAGSADKTVDEHPT